MTTLARQKKQSDTDRRISHQVGNRTEEAKAVVHSYQNIVETRQCSPFSTCDARGMLSQPRKGTRIYTKLTTGYPCRHQVSKKVNKSRSDVSAATPIE